MKGILELKVLQRLAFNFILLSPQIFILVSLSDIFFFNYTFLTVFQSLYYSYSQMLPIIRAAILIVCYFWIFFLFGKAMKNKMFKIGII